MSDALLPVVAVHGIGMGSDKDRAGFSGSLSQIVSEPERPVYRVGEYEKVIRKSVKGITWEEALWEGVNDPVDATTKVALTALIPNLPAQWLLPKAIDLLNDVPLYLGTQGPAIRAVVRDVIVRHPNCVVVAHSLGSVIAADVLNEASHGGQCAGLPVSGLITLGCPLNVLGLRHMMVKALPFKWYDYYHPSDPIHFKGDLQFKSVKTYRLDPKEPFVDAHNAYWSSNIIANAVYKLTQGG